MKFNLSVLQQILVAVVLVGFSTSSPAVTVAVAVAGTREDSIGSVRGGVAAIADEDGDNQRRTKGAKTSPSGVLVSGTDGTDGPTNTRLEAEIVLEKKKMTTTTSTRKFIQRSVIGIKRITCSSFSWNEKKCNQKGDGACKFKESKNKCKTTCGKITGKDPTQCENVKGCKLNSNGKCKKKKKKEPSAPTSAPPTSEPPTSEPPTSLRRVSDLPSCTDVDPVISADVTSAVIPLELLRQYTGTSPTTPPYVVSFDDKDQGGMVDVVTDPPTPCEDSTLLSNSALWCNTKGQQIIRAQTHGMCLQDSDPEYYYIKFVSTNYFATTGVCTLLRVSRNAPGTWTEYQTESMPTTGGAIEWVYDDEDVGKRFKYSLCPDTVDDKNKVVVTTFE